MSKNKRLLESLLAREAVGDAAAEMGRLIDADLETWGRAVGRSLEANMWLEEAGEPPPEQPAQVERRPWWKVW